MVGFLKNLFGGSDEPAKPALPTPLNLRIGAAVELDELYFRLAGDDLKFTAPKGPLLITGQGLVDLGDGTTALRYYTDDHVMVQLLCVGGTEESHVEEVTLYVPHDSKYPHGTSAWKEWTGDGVGHIGAPTCSLIEDVSYDRVWFDDSTDWAPPVEFTETVTVDGETGETSKIHQTVMLYARPLENERHEFLLLSREEAEDEASIEIMLGVDLMPGAFNVI